MCLKPKFIYKKGFYENDNYRGSKGQFYELSTFSKCGVCEQCLNEKANNWVVRNFYEEKRHERKCFITLTYRDSPYILVKKDLQDFMKRLRTKLDRSTGEKVRLFGAGEYGEVRGRPHYHVILYGWDDQHAFYQGINKKNNLVYCSNLIHEAWGLGRTSYQPFGEQEAPYLTMYNSPKETFKRAYKLSQENGRLLIQKVKDSSMKMNEAQRKNLLIELNDGLKKIEAEKQKYMMIKEFNSWSLSMGWEVFQDQYYKSPEYAFTEYIGNKEFVTPTPWVKRLANEGDVKAAEEMFRRERMIELSGSEREEAIKNSLKIAAKKKQKLMEWSQQKTKIECNL